jgi:ABC-type nitrate/sulfonate/bicarbonate transport system substrate-binding protein
LTGVDLAYVGFSYGGPLNSAALAGQIDVLLTADHPAAVLLAKGRGFKIVARMMYNRVCLYVPPGSKNDGLAKLRGKVVMGPIGAAAERVAIAELDRAGVPASSIQLSSVDMAQQNALVRRGGDWKGADALFGFDPLPAIWQASGLIDVLTCGRVVSVIAATEEMRTARSKELARFLDGFHLAWDLFRSEPAVLGMRFSKEAALEASQDALDLAASVEPNFKARSLSDIRLTFSEADLQTLEAAAQFLMDRGTIHREFRIRDHVDTAILESVLAARVFANLRNLVKLD